MIKLILFTIIFTTVILLGTVFVLPRFVRFARVYYKDYPILGSMLGRPVILEGYDDGTCSASGCELDISTCKITTLQDNGEDVTAFDCSYGCTNGADGATTCVDTDCSKCGVDGDGRDYLTLFDEIVGADPNVNTTPNGADDRNGPTTIIVNCSAAGQSDDVTTDNFQNPDYATHDQLAVDSELFNYGASSGNAGNAGNVGNVALSGGDVPNNIKDETTLNNSQYIHSTSGSVTIDFPIRNSVTGMFNVSGPCGHNQDEYVREEDGL
jgi:hypothetical protein